MKRTDMIAETQMLINELRANDLFYERRRQAVELIRHSDIKAHGKHFPFSYIPLLINGEDMAFFDDAVQKMHGILVKMTEHYIDDAEYRRLFHFSPAMEELICLPCRYAEMIPVGRYDLFFDPESRDFSFCEFNTDGSGGMSRDLEISAAILQSLQGTDFVLRHKLSVIDSIETIAGQLIRIYRSDPGAADDPCFAVVDFREEGVFSDFDRFIAAFQRHGIKARFTDVRDLVFDGNTLRDRNDGAVIDAVYRRLVTSVLLERRQECNDLIEAVRRGKVILLGHFRTSLAHSKTVDLVMHLPQTAALLTAEEQEFVRRHVPGTWRLDDDLPDELSDSIKANKEEWIIKPEEGFGSHGVFSGIDCSLEQWQRLLNEKKDQGYIVQQFCRRYPVPLLGPDDSEIVYHPLMIGVYQAAGRAAGFYSRAGDSGVIDFDHGGMCVSTLAVAER